MDVREDQKDLQSPPAESEEREDEDQVLDEAYVAEVFKKYRPVAFG